MKFIAVILFQLAFVVADTDRTGFLEENGAFRKKFIDAKIEDCIKDCDTFVDTEVCNSLQQSSAIEFSTLMNKVYERAKEPICVDLDLSQIPFGKVTISSADGDIKCNLTGLLNVAMSWNDITFNAVGIISTSNFIQQAVWQIEFSGLTASCQMCLRDDLSLTWLPPQLMGRVDVTLHLNVTQGISLLERGKHIFTDHKSTKAAASFAYPVAGEPADVYKPVLETVLAPAFNTQDVKDTVANFFALLSQVLLLNCVNPVCSAER